jgi:hypothetical protein
MRFAMRAWACAWLSLTSCGDQAAGSSGAGGMAGQGGAAAASGAAGIAGSGGGAGSGGAAGSSGASSNPTFTRVWSEVLSGKGCAGEFCHGSGTGALSMDNKVDAYLSLVGVPARGPACSQRGQLRVSPGKPEESLLLEKMSTLTPSCGDPMPIGVRFDPNCLSPSPAVCTTVGEIELVRGWIAAGALDD